VGVRPFSSGERENVNIGEAGVSDELACLLKVAVCFPWESCDPIGSEARRGQFGANVLEQLQESKCGVGAPHFSENPIAPALHRNVKVRCKIPVSRGEIHNTS